MILNSSTDKINSSKIRIKTLNLKGKIKSISDCQQIIQNRTNITKIFKNFVLKSFLFIRITYDIL